MTQFQPPPSPPPGPGPIAGQPAPMMPARPKPYSGISIAAFVLSILGCLGISAVLGFILGIVGIVITRKGQKRGMGLAIAALPISLVMGAISVLLFVSILFVGQSAIMLKQLPIFLSAEGEITDANLAEFRKICTADFNMNVSNEQMRAWVHKIVEEHGKFTEVNDNFEGATPGANGKFSVSVQAKFVNGPAQVTLVIVQDPFWEVNLDDIMIDGSSPRDGP